MTDLKKKIKGMKLKEQKIWLDYFLKQFPSDDAPFIVNKNLALILDAVDTKKLELIFLFSTTIHFLSGIKVCRLFWCILLLRKPKGKNPIG